MRRIYISLIISTLVTACSSAPDPEEEFSSTQNAPTPAPTPTLVTKPDLMMFYDEWYGTPYQWGGTEKSGIDCSAFVQKAFVEAYQVALPRTTRLQSKQGVKLDRKDAEHGDLVFFKTSRARYHVGIYLGNKQFMHVSEKKGVIISRTDNPYWASKFWQIRRVVPKQNFALAKQESREAINALFELNSPHLFNEN